MIPDMHGWEIIIPNDERASYSYWSHGDPHDHVFVTKIVGFGNHYAQQYWDENNFGSVQLSAGQEYLLTNYFNFEQYIGYVYCGGSQVIGTRNEIPKCYDIDDIKVVNVGLPTGYLPTARQL